MWLRLALKLALLISLISACSSPDRQAVDKLNALSYAYHYRNIDSTEYYARQALALSGTNADARAEAMNNLAFVCIARMHYQEAMALLDSIPDITDNHLELLVAYIQQMRLCQRMSHNRAFYDFREMAISSLMRINEERPLLNERQQLRLVYAESELAIVTSTYFYYVGLEQPSRQALEMVSPEVERDTAQFLNYLYNIGAGGIITNDSQEEINQQEFDHLMRCQLIARQQGSLFFMANSSEALAEHLISPAYRQQLIADNLPAMKFLNPNGVPERDLPVWLAEEALSRFIDYGDVYQIAGAYRTLASCYHAQGDDEGALYYLEQALSDSLIYQAPDLVASIRERLSVAYAAINDKQMSDLNRNIYLDLQEQTRQDRSLEARAGQLDESVIQLTRLLIAIGVGVVLLILLLIGFSIWHHRKQVAENKRNEENEREEELREQIAQAHLHIESSARRALEQRAKLSLVNSITPLIDRIIHEAHHLVREQQQGTEDTAETTAQRNERLQYINELVTKIEEQNSVLTHWIQLQKGELSLHIASFRLQDLFDMMAKSQIAFKMKGITLEIVPTEATVKADRVLTLFMLNTLADNARKFTGEGGLVTIRAEETPEYVEISVVDTGEGMSEEQVQQLTSGERITALRSGTVSQQGKNAQPSHGFGLLNCRGIIEKYRKVSKIFSVCMLSVESQIGQGSRFYFRLPKGIARIIIALAMLVPFGDVQATSPVVYMGNEEVAVTPDDYLNRAKSMADSLYNANVNGHHAQALSYADSCRWALNDYLNLLHPHCPDTLLRMGDLSLTPPEILWLYNNVRLDYDILLSMRNESAIAALALHNWELYSYNNRIYTQLYKELSADNTLDDYCRKMQQSQANKTIAVVLLVIVLLAIMLAVVLQLIRALNNSAKRQQEEQNKIDSLADELRRLQLEEATLYVSNAVLDNSLSTLKHETMYYPSRIRQLVEQGDIASLAEVVDYYRELYGLLSEQAMDQTNRIYLRIKPLEHGILGDQILIDTLFDLLKKEAKVKKLEVKYTYKKDYTICEVPMPTLQLTEQQTAELFTPSESNLSYYICRQICRDHGEATNRRGCAIRAELQNGITTIIITLPRNVYGQV